MLSFQDHVQKDIGDVFLNAAALEFVTPHMIGGTANKEAVECNIIIDRERYLERKQQDPIENVTLNGLSFFICKKEWLRKFEYIPKVDAALVLDEKRYVVEDVDDNMGVLEFSICASRGR